MNIFNDNMQWRFCKHEFYFFQYKYYNYHENVVLYIVSVIIKGIVTSQNLPLVREKYFVGMLLIPLCHGESRLGMQALHSWRMCSSS